MPVTGSPEGESTENFTATVFAPVRAPSAGDVIRTTGGRLPAMDGRAVCWPDAFRAAFSSRVVMSAARTSGW